MTTTGRMGGLVVGLLGLAWLWWPLGAAADVTHSVSVSATISGTTPPVTPNPVVQFSGLAAPQAAVTIQRDGAVATSLTAATNATFNVTLSGQPTGEHLYLVSAVDTEGRVHAPVTFALNLALGSTTIISGVFLGPSISTSEETVTLGDDIVVSGMTAPSSSVALSVSSVALQNYTVVADGQGRWQKSINTADLGVGDHTAQARALSGATISEFSSSVTFSVDPRDPCSGRARSDINCDTQVNLIDFSIMLYYWQTRNPANVRADIDRSGRVDVIDFSIMLYEWTG